MEEVWFSKSHRLRGWCGTSLLRTRVRARLLRESKHEPGLEWSGRWDALDLQSTAAHRFHRRGSRLLGLGNISRPLRQGLTFTGGAAVSYTHLRAHETR